MSDHDIKWELPGDDAFIYDSLGDVIDASGGDLVVGSVVRFGEFTQYRHLSASTIALEVMAAMDGHAKAEHDSLADDYLSSTLSHHHDSLVNHVREWLSELPAAAFGSIKNIQEYTITDEDMA